MLYEEEYDPYPEHDPYPLAHSKPPPGQPIQKPSHLPPSQSLITLTIGPSRSPFTLHQQLLCSSSKYFNRMLRGPWKHHAQPTIHLPDTNTRTFHLFQWWLYAQPSRSSTLTPSLPAPRPLGATLDFLAQRNPPTASNLLPRGHDSLASWMTRAPWPDLLAYARREVPPQWTNPASLPASAPAPNPKYHSVLLHLYAFAHRYDVPSLRDDTMTLLATLDAALSRAHPLSISPSLFTQRDDLTLLDAQLPDTSPMRRYWFRRVALMKWDAGRGKEDGLSQGIPQGSLMDVTLGMSEIVHGGREGAERYLRDCCNFHEHGDGGGEVGCRASYHYDGTFYGGFLEACVGKGRREVG